MDKVIHNFTHVQQRSDWDCGVACVAMCLNCSQQEALLSNLDYFSNNEETGFGTSIWTIDLCYLLSQFRVKHKMYTGTLGIDPSVEKDSFCQSIIDSDTERVLKRLLDSKNYGIEVEERQLSINYILQLLRTSGPLIVLVNGNLLTCTDCRKNIVCTKTCDVAFEGHYILVIGFDLMRGIILYRDPTNTDRICLTPMADFEIARSSLGTDFDIIQIEDMGKTNSP